MKKALIAITILLTLMIIIIGSLIAALQTQYGAPIVNYLLRDTFNEKISVESASLTLPYHITLTGINIHAPETEVKIETGTETKAEIKKGIEDKATTTAATTTEITAIADTNPDIQQIDIWINAASFLEGRPIFDSVLINGVNWQQGSKSFSSQAFPSQAFSPQEFITRNNITLHQIAINNLNVEHGNASAHGVNLQVQKPQWTTPQQILPFGEMQITAEQAHWNKERIDRILVDAVIKPQDSTVYGASFDWRSAKVSGQAEQFATGWSLINITIDGLILSSEDTHSLLNKSWAEGLSQISHINSLDVLRSDWQWKDWHLAGFDASIENITLPFQLWQQDKGSFSLQADSITNQKSDQYQQWVEPSFNTTLNTDKITVTDFATQWHQGQVQLSGDIFPSGLHLNTLSAQSVKLIANKQQTFPRLSFPMLSQWIDQLQDVSIDVLDIKRSQIIQLEQQPYWQASGLEIEGKQLSLISQGKKGLWQGDLFVAVNNASYSRILTSHAMMKMNSEQGHWHLTRLFAPLEDGYIEAQADLDFSQVSQPWRLLMSVDGLPIAPLLSTQTLPFSLKGLAEFELEAQGLSGDHHMLAHSLTGQFNGSIRDTQLTNKRLNDVRDVTISDIAVSMDRGRITINDTQLLGKGVKGTLQGDIDLLKPEDHDISINLDFKCSSLSVGVLTEGGIKIKDNAVCQENKTLPASPAPSVVIPAKETE